MYLFQTLQNKQGTHALLFAVVADLIRESFLLHLLMMTVEHTMDEKAVEALD